MGRLANAWKAIFGVPEQKAASLSALLMQLGATWTPWSFASYASEAYCGNPYVHRATRMIADAISALVVYPMGVETGEDGTPERKPVGDSHPMQRVLLHPNGYQGWEQFCQEWVAHMLLAGESYVLLPETRSELLTFNLLRPDMVEILPMLDKQGAPVKHLARAYAYDTGSGRVEYPPERVVHVYLYNPLDDWHGLSPLSPAAKSVDLNNSGRTFHKALFDNGAVGGVVITSTEGATGPELEALRDQIRLKKAGAIRAGETWLLPSTQKMEKAAWSPRDALTPEIMVMSLREVAVALGIDPALLGDSTSKIYANVREARAALYIDAALPLAGTLFGALSASLQAWYPGVEYTVDKDQIDELSESQDALWKRASEGVGGALITPNEGRDLIGYEKVAPLAGEEQSWADDFYFKSPTGLVSMTKKPAPTPAPVLPFGNPLGLPVGGAQEGVPAEGLSALLDEVEAKLDAGDVGGALDLAGKAARAGRSRALTRLEERAVPIFERVLRKLIAQAREQALSRAGLPS